MSPPEYIFRFLGCILIPVCALERWNAIKVKGQGTVSREVAAKDVQVGRWQSLASGKVKRSEGGQGKGAL